MTGVLSSYRISLPVSSIADVRLKDVILFRNECVPVVKALEGDTTSEKNISGKMFRINSLTYECFS